MGISKQLVSCRDQLSNSKKSSEYHWLGSVLRIFQLLVEQTQQRELPEIISEL